MFLEPYLTLNPEHLIHRIPSRWLGLEPERRFQRAARENGAVLGAVGEFDALILRHEIDGVVPRDGATAQAGKSNRTLCPCAGQSVTTTLAHLVQTDTAPRCRCLTQQQSCSRRRVYLVPVVHFGDLYVPVGTELRRSLPHQPGQQCDAKGRVAGLEDRDVSRRVVDALMVPFFKPCRTDHDWNARSHRRAQIFNEGRRRGEVDQDVAVFGKRDGVPALINRARNRETAHPRRLDQRLSHAPKAPNNADCCHALPFASLPCFMRWMQKLRNIVILTGAGISAESGIGTFRDKGGLWEKHRVEDVATPEGFARDPDLVLRFYDMRREAIQQAQPNPAHWALAALDAAWEGELLIVTQNVDDLHERAGAKRLIHMHGEHLKAWCTRCDSRALWRDTLIERPPCPACGARTLRPDVVWFGEMPYQMDAIETALRRADLFVSIGTSGAVYPAAGFVRTARYHGAQTLELNMDPSQGSIHFHASRMGKASDLVPEWVEEMLGATI